MDNAPSPAVQRVQEALERLGAATRITEMTQATRTSADAAGALGCQVGQIAKSLVFRGASTGRPVLVIASGANRVDEAKIAALLGETIGKADAAFVREATGFAIGGVPPVGHRASITTLIDGDLLRWDRIWAAGGTPNSIFPLTPAELVRITGGRVGDVKADG
jgi:prolyl-tRNA editing enzyme YbaK/EbsC (Cys-tRNA(Pro) deacylase)